MKKDKIQNRVLIFVPFFGKLPTTFETWLSSCSNNPNFNWMLLTDDHMNYEYPQNVQVIYTTLLEIKELFESKLGFQVALERPYKLCDFRPLYGFLFDQYLNGYTHWGYCDLDVLFGDLDSFITNEMLRTYSKINVLGHLSILKHSKSVDMAFKQCDYKAILQTSSNRIFDEIRYLPNINSILKSNGERIKEMIPYTDIGALHYCFYTFEYNGTNRTSKMDIPASIMKYDNGRLYQIWIDKGKEQSREVAYVHFQKRKIMVDKGVDKNSFYLVPNEMVSTNENEEDLIRRHTHDDLRYTVNMVMNKVKRRILK